MNKLFILSLFLVNLVFCNAQKNPLEGKPFYLHQKFQENVDNAINSLDISDADYGMVISSLVRARETPTAYWLNSLSKVQMNDSSLDSMNGILASAAQKRPAPMVMFVIDNLPNRNCASPANRGEICCTANADNTCDYVKQGNCNEGLKIYKHSFIDNIIGILNVYKNIVPTGFIIEPHAIGAMVTDTTSKPVCNNTATQTSYKEGLSYAISQLSIIHPTSPMYLGLGHSHWLGWDTNANRAAEIINSWKILDHLRGFATNIGNYQPIGQACPDYAFCHPSNNNSDHPCCDNPCGTNLIENPANNELNYVLRMQALFPGKFYVIDTGRSGNPNARKDCGNWCNIRNTGFGPLPTTDTPLGIVDAYLWINTPGESDGCTQQLPSGASCTRFDTACNSNESIGSIIGEPRMPDHTQWSEYDIVMLARNANFNDVAAPIPI